MPRLTVNQRTKIIEWWHETKCVPQIQRNFRRHFHVVHAPGLKPTRLFFLWGYLKDRIYSNPRPRRLDQLNDNIRREIRNIPQEPFPRVMENMAVRVQNVTGRRGACGKRCLKFKGLIKAMEDKVGEKCL